MCNRIGFQIDNYIFRDENGLVIKKGKGHLKYDRNSKSEMRNSVHHFEDDAALYQAARKSTYLLQVLELVSKPCSANNLSNLVEILQKYKDAIVKDKIDEVGKIVNNWPIIFEQDKVTLASGKFVRYKLYAVYESIHKEIIIWITKEFSIKLQISELDLSKCIQDPATAIANIGPCGFEKLSTLYN